MSFLGSSKENHRSGFIALIGRPNVGKSTLINKFVGEKVAITSPVAQTTRNRLRAVVTSPNAQLIIVDTPGIHKPHHLLGDHLVKSAKMTIGEVDLVLLILEGNKTPGRGDEYIVNLLRQQNSPVMVALNKWDLLTENMKEKMFELYQNLLADFSWPLFTCSALSGEGCIELLDSFIERLPIGPQLFPPETITDQPEKLLLGELIREQVLFETREEVPHSVAVLIDRVEEIPPSKRVKSNQVRTAVLATIFVERKSQKGILIGKGGAMLKRIGQGARLNMQKLIDGPVYLELFVKVVPDWRRKPARLAELGYQEK